VIKKKDRIIRGKEKRKNCEAKRQVLTIARRNRKDERWRISGDKRDRKKVRGKIKRAEEATL